MNEITYNIISSSSAGNCVIVNDVIAVDMGVSFKALKDVYKQIQIVLLTHEHGDHFNKTTIRRLATERPTIRFACCEWLVNDLVNAGVNPRNIDVLEIGKLYDYRVFKVSPVKLYHDVPNCGYRVFANGKKAIYCTDTEHLDGITAKEYDLYMIEANYEVDELQERINRKLETGEYCYELNVANRHLSKEQADEFILGNMGSHSDYVYLHGHKDKSEQAEDWGYHDE